jgi:hypothetical protein
MPSPFPGMDPYLEGALWTTVHFSLSAEIVRQLAPKLRPRYLVLPAERFVTEMRCTPSSRQKRVIFKRDDYTFEPKYIAAGV